MATQQTPTRRPARHASPLQVLATRLLGHTALYASGTFLSMAFALINLAVLTRLLDRSAFGAFAILTLYSGLITLLCNLGTVQGTMASAYSGGAVDEGGMDDDEGGAVDTQPTTDNRRRLTTGLVLTIGVGLTLTLLSVPISPEISQTLIGSPSYAEAAVWATAAGGLGSVWRILSGLPRIERRPRTYIALQLGRSTLVLGCGALLIEAGYGLTGAVAGYVLGKTVAAGIALYISRYRFRWAFSRSDANAIVRNGRPLIVISVGFFLARNVDLFVLSRYATNADVAIYRVAERIGQMPAFAVSAALIAWGPILRGPIRVALDNQSGVDVARSRLVTYYVYLAMFIVVGVAMFADVLIRVAPEAYRGATDVLIVMAVAAGFHGGLTVTYRMTRIPKKIALFRRVAVLTFLVTLGVALALVPSLGLRGAAYASLVSSLPGLSLMLWRSQRGEEPLELDVRRLAACVALGVAWVAVGWSLRELLPGLHTVIDFVFCFGYPALLVVTGIVPRSEAKRLLGLFTSPVRSGSERRTLRERLAMLDESDRDLLRALAQRQARPSEVAARHGETVDGVLARFVRLLRQLDGVGTESEADSEIGRFLLSAKSTPQRDRMGHMLSLRQDVVPLELDRLVVVLKRVRAAR